MLQDILAFLLKDTTLYGAIAALVVGYVAKRWPVFSNRFIPVATAVVAVITQLINLFHGAAGATVPVVPADSTSVMGFFDGGLIKALLAAVLQWALTDKVYTTQQKLVVGLTSDSDKEAKQRLSGVSRSR
jgi:hypothetical protein